MENLNNCSVFHFFYQHFHTVDSRSKKRYNKFARTYVRKEVKIRSEYIPPEAQAAIRARLGAGDKLIWDICIATGARIDDVLSLRAWQVKPQFTMKERKTGHIRTVELPEEIYTRVKQVAKRRKPLQYLFPAIRHGYRRKQNRTTVWRHIKKAAERAGYADKVYTPHSLRKIYAVNALRRTHSLQAVQSDLGHKNMYTTMIYALSDHAAEYGL